MQDTMNTGLLRLKRVERMDTVFAHNAMMSSEAKKLQNKLLFQTRLRILLRGAVGILDSIK